MPPKLKVAAEQQVNPGWFNEPSTPTKKVRCLLLESISQSAVDVMTEAGFEVECVHKLSEAELMQRIKGVHVLGVRSKTAVTAELLKAADELLTVGAFCIGTDQVDLEAAALSGVPVFNAPFANTRSVAEMVLAEMIVLARQISDRSSECHRGVWKKLSSGCYEVRGKRLGIVGYGHVGSQLSVLAESMGMRVSFYDVLNKLPLGNARSVASLEALLSGSDFVSVHVPGTDQTRGLIGAAQIAQMPRGSYLINAARGTVVDVEAAAAALRSGHLAGAAFDVFPDEPASSAEEFVTPLRGCPNTVLTPHIGGSTEEAQSAIGLEVARKLVNFVKLGSTSDAVNFPDVMLPEDSSATTHRIFNVHRNVPGVLRDINMVLSQYNVLGQVLRTKGEIGVMLIDINSAASRRCRVAIEELGSNISTRVLR